MAGTRDFSSETQADGDADRLEREPDDAGATDGGGTADVAGGLVRLGGLDREEDELD